MGTLTKGVVKAVGMLSGVQVISVLSSVVRVKIVAIWLGPAGIGLIGIFQTALDMLGTIAQMGIGVSGTREVAMAENAAVKSRAVAVVKAWGLRLALIGVLLTLLAAPWLSLWSFNDMSHTGWFMLLGAGVAFTVGAAMVSSLLRGTASYGALARGTLTGAVGGVAVVVPLIILFREHGIAPAVTLAAGVSLIGFWWAARRDRTLSSLPPLTHPLSCESIIADGRRLISLGWWVTLGYAAGDLANYSLLSYINRAASTAEAGYFQAGYTLLVRYTSFIFGALAAEYFPRVSAVHGSARRLSVYASHEVSLLMWVFVPVCAAFIAGAPLMVEVLYAPDFECVLPYLYTGALGAVLRCWSTSLSYIILAKGDGPRYLLSEVLIAVGFVGLGILCYSQWGLNGMGVAYVGSYIFESVLLWLLTRRYGVRVNPRTVRQMALALLTVSACSAMAVLLPQYWLGNVLCALVALGAGGLGVMKFYSTKTR
ncbi:MAG: oligosaccharide flippase family protein [Candidatus Amulumruptor caecigallinarius]|nr:oligosaccharide flippase family protein [Candidatus Amulumruptor caecigallinarius]MCM1397800.1 oligosaccharide flippase family protein [Candidatus Amulumruptor caecigallinarius]MCM1454848.1 oligosaccharide flippase family protein [bacterium]